MGAGPVVGPGRGGQALGHRGAQQPVPARVERDLVDPVAEAVVRTQFRLVPVGLLAPLLGLRATRQAAEPTDVVLGPAPTLPAEPFQQCRVIGRVVRSQGGGLVGDVVRGGLLRREYGDHVRSVALFLRSQQWCNSHLSRPPLRPASRPLPGLASRPPLWPASPDRAQCRPCG